jgi:hypothetical protein
MQGFYDSIGNPVKGFNVYTEDGRNFILTEDYAYERKDGCRITIPKGATSDGASTPPALWPTLPPFGRYWPAAYLHDYLYRNPSPDKDFADETLLDAMEFLGVWDVDAKIIYEGVARFGSSSYEADVKEWKAKSGV